METERDTSAHVSYEKKEGDQVDERKGLGDEYDLGKKIRNKKGTGC